MNKEIKSKDLKQIEEKIGYKFKNKNLLVQAFTRKSYSEENGGEDNEVLEFIGDKVLDLVVVKELMERFGDFTNELVNEDSDDEDFIPYEFHTTYDEGQFTEIKKSLVEKKALAKFMTHLDLSKYLIMGNGDIKNKINEEDSVKEDLFEAILGAIAIDSNWDLDLLDYVSSEMIDYETFFGFNEWCGEEYYGILKEITNDDEINTFETSYEKINNEYKVVISFKDYDRLFIGIGFTLDMALNRAARRAVKFYDGRVKMESELNEVVDIPLIDKAINQLQELSQKKFIGDITYTDSQSYDSNGNSIWKVNCSVNDFKSSFYGINSKKTTAKKIAAYLMVNNIYNTKFLNCDDVKDLGIKDLEVVKRAKYYQGIMNNLIHFLEYKIINKDFITTIEYNYDLLNNYYNSSEYKKDIKVENIFDIDVDSISGLYDEDCIKPLLISIKELLGK